MYIYTVEYGSYVCHVWQIHMSVMSHRFICLSVWQMTHIPRCLWCVTRMNMHNAFAQTVCAMAHHIRTDSLWYDTARVAYHRLTPRQSVVCMQWYVYDPYSCSLRYVCSNMYMTHIRAVCDMYAVICIWPMFLHSVMCLYDTYRSLWDVTRMNMHNAFVCVCVAHDLDAMPRICNEHVHYGICVISSIGYVWMHKCVLQILRSLLLNCTSLLSKCCIWVICSIWLVTQIEIKDTFVSVCGTTQT